MFTEVQKAEQQIEDMKESIKLSEAIDRLYKNPDFITVILKEFMTDEALRYLETSADPDLPEKEREGALAIAQAGSHLRRFLAARRNIAATHRAQLPDYEQNLVDLRQLEGE